ncbi:MAG: LysR family transcriptional regulator [Pseudomonadota bacterium]
MNLRQLEAFRATMLCGSITDAAKMLHISQPSVSRLIADLEQSVGFQLFARVGRGLSPTVEGRTFYQGVDDMFVGIDQLDDLAKSIRISQGGSISIGAIQSIATIELPIAVSRIYRENPDIHFVIHSRNTPAIVEDVQARKIDIGVVGREPDYHGVEVLFQSAAPYVCLLPESHPLADEIGPVDLAALVDTETFVTFGGNYPDSMLSIDSELSTRMKRRSRLSVANLPVAAALVREAGVLAIADPFSAEQAVRIGGVVFRPLQQELTYSIALIAAGRDLLSRQAIEFVEQFAEQLSERVRYVSSLSNV